MIKLEHVSKAYSAGVPAVNDVNLEIDDGEFVFIVGDSGSGKSTIIKLLLKELEPTEGTITINEKVLSKIKRKQVPKFRRNVGVVFQDFRLLKDRNVYDNIAFAQKVIGRSTAHIKKRVPQMLAMVGLAAKYKSKPRELSGGEQQRIALAIALANKPKILLADEPTGSVDSKTGNYILDVFRKVNKEWGITVVIVTHDMELTKKVNRVISIRDGKMSSEFIMKKDYAKELENIELLSEQEETLQKYNNEIVHEEYAVLDRAGRVQIPKEYLDTIGVKGKRIKLECKDRKIIITAEEE